jgi:hypothetical protein
MLSRQKIACVSLNKWLHEAENEAKLEIKVTSQHAMRGTQGTALLILKPLL